MGNLKELLGYQDTQGRHITSASIVCLLEAIHGKQESIQSAMTWLKIRTVSVRTLRLRHYSQHR
jgi:hypothetical protein